MIARYKIIANIYGEEVKEISQWKPWHKPKVVSQTSSHMIEQVQALGFQTNVNDRPYIVNWREGN